MVSRNNRITNIVESIGSLTREFNANCKYPFMDYPLSKPHIDVLFMLSQHSPLTIKQISEKLHVTSGAATQFITSLDELDLVVKSDNPDDKRSRLVRLSQAAESELRTFRLEYINTVGKPFETLTIHDLVALDELLTKVKKGRK